MRLYTGLPRRTKAGANARIGCAHLVAAAAALYPSPLMQRSFPRYLAVSALSLLSILAISWIYVALAPMAFMESGYAAWAAKSTMLRECRLGQLTFFGDSRLEAGVIPAALPVPASNFGLAAGTPIETDAAIRRALTCPELPRQAVIALVPEHFGPLQKFFWILSLRYGFLSAGDLSRIESQASALGDTETLAAKTPDGLGGPIRDWLYLARFPSLTFSSIVQGRVFGRYSGNSARYDEILRARGWAAYEGGEPFYSDNPDVFVATPLKKAVFEHAIAALRDRGVDVSLMIMPFAETHRETDAMFAQYVDYLHDVVRRFPGVQLVNDRVAFWPDQMFADRTHLQPEGARLFSERLSACMQGGRLQPACDLSWKPIAARAGSAVLEVQQQGNGQH